MNKSVLIVGVGGQGTLLASRILGAYAMIKGYDVKLSEVHGMSQRGGSVVTHVRFGEKIYSPIIPIGDADYILAFEELEGLRFIDYLNEDGLIFVNTQRIPPMPVITGSAVYPENIEEKIGNKRASVFIDALALAEQAGSQRAVNTVLVGALLKELGATEDESLEALRSVVKPSILEINELAIKSGYNAI